MVSGLLMDQTRDSESETNKTSSNIQPHHRVLKFRNRFSRCPAHAPEIIRAGLWRCIENQAAVQRADGGEAAIVEAKFMCALSDRGFHG